MTDNKVYKILAEFQSYDDQKWPGRYVISYKQPNSKDPARVWNHKAVEADLSDDAISRLVNANAGERFCVHQSKDAEGYPNIVNITDAKDAEKPAAKSGAKYNNNNNNSNGNAIGQQVGNALNVAAITLGVGCSEDDILKRARWVISAGEILKTELKASNAAKTAVAEKKEEAAKPLTRAEKMKTEKAAAVKPVEKKEELEETLEDDSLDNINFEE